MVNNVFIIHPIILFIIEIYLDDDSSDSEDDEKPKKSKRSLNDNEFEEVPIDQRMF